MRAIRTAGDRSRASLSEIGGRGVFVAELERALLDGKIDIAVHSLKDMPSESTDGLAVAAVTERADVRDVLVSRQGLTLAALPEGAAVGTGSPRRAVQLLAARPDLRIADIRGNVDTRIRKVEDGQYDAAVLAAAGLARLGLLDRASEVLSTEVMLPAVGQGALAIQVRADDAEAAEMVAVLDDAESHSATAAERAFEARLGGGCHAAMAALGEVKNLGSSLRLRGLVGDSASGRIVRGEVEGSIEDAVPLGVRLAEQLLSQGAAELLAAAPSGEATV
jgi:hydroxymethylbilane synthase